MATTTRSKSASPRKRSSRSASSNSPATPQKAKPTRKPRHCLKCPDRPLLSTCEHRFRKRQAPPVTNSGEEVAPAVSVSALPADPFLNVIDPSLVEEDRRNGRLAPSTPSPVSSNVSASPPGILPTPSPSPVGTPGLGFGSANADPQTTPMSISSDRPPLLTPRRVAESPDGTVKEKRRQPSGTNAKFGKVEGAGRGNDVWDVYRVRHLKPPIKEQAEATRKLERWTIDLMSRAESISTRTGCWLYLAIQHPASKTPFAHYVSRKLRNDAPEDVAVIHKEVRHTMNNLTRAHKRGLLEAEKALQDAKAQAEAANERAERAEDELSRLKRVLMAQGIILAN